MRSDTEFLSTAPLGSPKESDPPPLEARRSATLPVDAVEQTGAPKTTSYKRIIVCCDGTWQDGIVKKHRWQYSNVLKLARCLNHEDTRHDPPIPQIVFYQSGVGTETNTAATWLEGATGETLGDKVQDAYAFISQNFQPGDEVFCFGFSRGAYTARMVAAFVGEIGILDKSQMDHFADIFVAFQKRGKTDDPQVKAECQKILAPFNAGNSKGIVRANAAGRLFSLKCVGVFDTVGALGLPKELTMMTAQSIFGFNDTLLGPHIERALHALALNETRADFNCTKFQQTPEGQSKGQILRQCWFAGSHSDIGGGWEYHDLSDVTLSWMAANIDDILSLDLEYLNTLFNPNSPWGAQLPHNPKTGVFTLAETLNRELPKPNDLITHETIHPSVRRQKVMIPAVEQLLKDHPEIEWKLLPFEEAVEKTWPFIPGRNVPAGQEATDEVEAQTSEEKTLKSMAKTALEPVHKTTTLHEEGGRPVNVRSTSGSWLRALLGRTGK
ncbi:hypothetical protein SISNIDRAFT_451651 [Sistotremastrum niveocremeum HHB9708]|uniref:T6SS Phospholipase effector Tle1-like catalytic domain-containing protein n=1 Tax=Sistotremastrum niveocremeum HHB9708 TaxID=1314777 RepID=A0A164XHU6_9AGAM|nr:hypothetical protein SISNIDRAFT_451651 [Sistotremastrum niveocremeum HHB9708]